MRSARGAREEQQRLARVHGVMRPLVLAALLVLACGSSASQVAAGRACDLSAVPTTPPTAPIVKGRPVPASFADPSQAIADAGARSDAALAAFRASGCEPRALRQVAVSHLDGPGPVTLEDAVARADTIVVGRVRSIEPLDVYAPARQGPVSTARIDVVQTLKGTPRPSLEARQFGGIAPQPDGLVLGHLGMELILPGDEVVLLLERNAGAFWTVYPLGAIRVRGSALDPAAVAVGGREDPAAGIRAMTRAQLLARLQVLVAR